jgi:hypothetical protein
VLLYIHIDRLVQSGYSFHILMKIFYFQQVLENFLNLVQSGPNCSMLTDERTDRQTYNHENVNNNKSRDVNCGPKWGNILYYNHFKISSYFIQ